MLVSVSGVSVSGVSVSVCVSVSGVASVKEQKVKNKKQKDVLSFFSFPCLPSDD